MLGSSSSSSTPAMLQSNADSIASAGVAARGHGEDPAAALLWLQQFVATSLSSRSQGDVAAFERLTVLVQRADTPSQQLRWLSVLKLCVSQLTDECSDLVRCLLRYDWTLSDELAEVFLEFCILLVSANTCYLQLVLEALVRRWLPVAAAATDSLAAERYQSVVSLTHESLQHILSIVPTAPSALLVVIGACYPHRRHTVLVQTRFLSQVLRVVDYAPVLQDKLLAAVVERILLIDVEIKLDEEEDVPLFALDGVAEPVDEMAEKLDAMLVVCFQWLLDRQAAGTGCDTLFYSLLAVFHSNVLTTYRSKYTQFLLFAACAAQPQTYSNIFVTSLVERIASTSEDLISRLAAASYIGGFLSRAEFVPPATIHATFDVLLAWLHRYLDEVDANVVLPDPAVHAVFYATCQAVLYTMCFRYRELHQYLRGIGQWPGAVDAWRLHRLLHSNLNPLRVCLATVAREFVAVLNTLGLTDVAATDVMRRNAVVRLMVYPAGTREAVPLEWDSFFPFDPILLRESERYVRDLYHEWDANDRDGDDDDDHDDEDGDDDLDDGNDEDPDGRAIAAASDVRAGRAMAMAFTPEVESDLAFHQRFDNVRVGKRRSSSSASLASSGALAKSPGFTPSPLMTRKSRRKPGERVSSLAP